MYEAPMHIPLQKQEIPGTVRKLAPKADHGESSCKGSGKLAGKKVLITGETAASGVQLPLHCT